MLWETFAAIRDLGRLHDIASVLIRYGFGDLVRRLGLASSLERAGKILHWHEQSELTTLEPATRVRKALEELGPSFVKLGQILATRVDLFPDEWISEFSKLQDQAPALPFEALRPQLLEDLGEAPETVFAHIATTPLAAASLAQVHQAILQDGTAVVLKIRRPGIRPIVEADLRLLARLAEIFENEIPDLCRYHPKEIVRQFTLSLRRELDFAAECRNAERVAALFQDQPNIVIPRVHWQWCGERLNVQDFIAGISGRDLAGADAAGLDRRQLARSGAEAVLRMMLESGFFHADPHPGNVFYLPDNRIAFIDFGMIGRLSPERRTQVAQLLHGLVSRNSELVVDILEDWSRSGEGPTTDARNRLASEVDSFLDTYHGLPLAQLNLGRLLNDLLTLLRDNALHLPPDLALMIKAFVTLEGMGRQLDPQFDISSEARPFLERLLLAHASPEALLRRNWQALGSSMGLLRHLPGDLHQFLRSTRQGKLQVEVDAPVLRQFSQQLDKAASRLSLAIALAALTIGSAIVVSAHGAMLPKDLGAFGTVGFIGALIGGLWLLVSILRSGRRF